MVLSSCRDNCSIPVKIQKGRKNMVSLSAVFSKFIAIILFAVSFLIPGSPDKMDISVTVDNTETQIITVEWTNRTGKAVTIPRYYMEKLDGEEWTEIPFSPDFGGFPEIYGQYYPTEGGKITVDTQRTFGTVLCAGTYRITLYYDVLHCDINSGKCAENFIID